MDLQTKVNRELLRYAVGRAISCPVTGLVMDARKAVLVSLSFPSGNESEVCLSADGWASVEPRFREAMDAGKYTKIDVLDGRQLFKRAR